MYPRYKLNKPYKNILKSKTTTDIMMLGKMIYKEKQRGSPLLGANKYTHIYIMCKYIIYLFETIVFT